MVKAPYIFLRFNDSVRVLNLQTKRYTTLVKFPLSPVSIKYPMGSSLFVHRGDDQNPNSNWHLFTMGEFIRQSQGGQQAQNRRSQCTKLLKLHFDSTYLRTKEQEQAMEGRETLENNTEIVIRPIILNEVNLD